MTIDCWMKFSDVELQHFGRGTKWPQFQIKTQPFCNMLFTDIWYIKLYDEFIYHIWLQQRSWVDNPQSVSQSKRSISNNMGVVRTSIVRFHVTSRRPYLGTKQWIGGHVCVQKKILWELNSFHMLKLSFIPSNLQSSCCWPRDWKRSMKQPLFKNTVLPPKVCMTIVQFLRLYNFLRDDFRHQETMQIQNIGRKARSVVVF